MKRFLLLGLAGALGTSSAFCALVTWDFNPNKLDQPVGSPINTYVQSGYSLKVTGYDNDLNGPNGVDPFHQLQYKNEPPEGGAIEVGLGLVNTNANEINVNPDGTPAQYIQLDLRPLLMAGFINGQISIGSIQNGESFALYGSNIQSTLGTQLPGVYSGLAFDNKFVAIPSFGQFQFINIVAITGRVLAVAFQAEINPIPEVSALLPIIGLAAAIFISRYVSRRRSARAG